MNESTNDFAKLNSEVVADLPDWKRQYDLRVSSYNSTPAQDNQAAPAEVLPPTAALSTSPDRR